MRPIPVNSKVIRRLVRTTAPLIFALLVTTFVIAVAVSFDLRAQESEVVDRIVAVVNNKIITLYDLNRAFAPYVNNIKALKYPPAKERQTLFQVRQDLLNQLIDRMLADQLAQRDKSHRQPTRDK